VTWWRLGTLLPLAVAAISGAAMVLAAWLPTVSMFISLAVPLLYFVLVTALRSRSTTWADKDVPRPQGQTVPSQPAVASTQAERCDA